MKISYHVYELRPRRGLANAREGALLRVTFGGARVGFADLHPLPEFGDEPLEGHLEALARGEDTELTKRALFFATEDAGYRVENRNAFLGLALPRAHRLVTDLRGLDADAAARWVGQGFTHVKVKTGRDLDLEAAALTALAAAAPGLRWRLDFNGRVSVGDFTEWWRELAPPVRDRVDFVEDPCAGQLNIPGPWADDWAYQASARVRIVKPAREDVDQVGGYPRVVFTHSFDHVFGCACALWEAAMFYRAFPELTEVGGLGGVDTFAPDPFSTAWPDVGPRLRPTPGTGFGFDEQLKELTWRTLR